VRARRPRFARSRRGHRPGRRRSRAGGRRRGRSVSGGRAVADARRYLEIVYTLAQRDFQARFRGSWLGLLGLVVVPMLFLTAYTFVFSTLMAVRIPPHASREDCAF